MVENLSQKLLEAEVRYRNSIALAQRAVKIAEQDLEALKKLLLNDNLKTT